jgi:hypothetical protein
MAVDISALPSTNRLMNGEGLNLAGEGFNLKKALRTASNVADVALPLATALGGPEVAAGAASAMAAKKILDGSGLQGSGLRGGRVGKGTIKKAAAGAAKAAKIGEKLVQEFGTESQKKKAAKARKVADIIGSGHGGQDLRKKVMAHHYG